MTFFRGKWLRPLPTVPLQWVLVVPFVVQTVGTAAVVGYLSHRSGQQAVDTLANQRMGKTGHLALRLPAPVYDKAKQFLTVTSYNDTLGLDWLVTTVIPESAFRGEIQRYLRNMLWLCLLAIGVSTILGLLIAHYFARRIGDRKATEMALMETTAFLNEAHRIARLGSWSWNLVSGERWWSPQMYQIVGLDPASDPIPPDLESANQWVHPEDRERVDHTTRAAIEQGLPYEIEFRFYRPDGSLREVFSAGLVERDAAGHPTRFWGITQDITDRKQIEAHLGRTEKWLHQYSRQAPSSIYTIVQNPDGYVWLEYTSSAVETIHEVGQAEVMTNASILFDHMHPEDRAGYAAAVAQSAENLELFSHEWRIITPSGKMKWLQAKSQPERRSNGAIAWHGVVLDITDRKQTEEELRQAKLAAEAANAAKSAFLANMSHEFRTPLNSILGFTQLIRMQHRPALSPDVQKHLQVIEKSGKHLLELINDVLDLSRIEAEKLVKQDQELDLVDLLQLLTTTFSHRASKQAVNLQVDLQPGVPQCIVADAQKLRQVLINLLGNAIKFTRQGCVTLRVGIGNWSDGMQRPSYAPTMIPLQFEIEDTGSGIAPQELTVIFDAFTQAAAGRQASEGTGLGLTISRQLVHVMGGEITVRSVLGEGSTFQFTIPVQTTEATGEPAAPLERAVAGLAPHQPTYRVLVVDDHLANRLLLVQLLQGLGLNVQEAADGEQAIALWRQWSPHLIWMDMRMPIVDGYTTTRRIRAEEAEQHRPHRTVIIALTAQTTRGDRALVLEAGCDDYISKPFDAKALFHLMQEHLGLVYTYYEQSLPGQPSSVHTASTTFDLTVMPETWIAELHQAALRCHQKAVMQLIQQIPPEHSSLASLLRRHSTHFAFDRIVTMTRCHLH